MIIETISKSASTENRLAARQWVDAFNARDDEGEADARTADYIGHAPDSMRLPALDSTGTHTGQFRGLPPTGRKVRFSGLEISRMVDGKAAEHWFQMDTLTMFEQLGLRVVPGPRLLPRLMTAPLMRLSKKWALRRPTAA